MEFCSRSGLRLLVIFCIWAGLCGVLASAQSHRPKNVQVALRAKWEGTPLLLEAAELISKEGKDLYWEFIELWLQKEKDAGDSASAKVCLHKIIDCGRSLLSGHLASMFDFSLILRSASPSLVLYRQLAEESLSSFPTDEVVSNSGEGSMETNRAAKNLNTLVVGLNPKSPGGKCCWVDTGGSLFFDVPELLSWLDSSDKVRDSFQQPEIFDFDHLYFEANATSPVSILYASLGTNCFREFHSVLVKAAKEGKVRYVVRPVLPSGCEASSNACATVGSKASVNLGGYGVELALKNMEYKAMDDSTVKKSVTLEDAHTDDLSQEVRGFIFSKILERKPEFSSEIMAFRDYLFSSTVSDTLDIWELKDLGHQTAQKIVHSSDPLQAMQDINQNFPSIVSSLSRMKLNESVKEEILANQRMVPPGKSLMAINGALVNIEDIDLFLLVDLVHKELSLADQFSKLKIPDPSISKLLSTTPSAESTTFRIDFRSRHVHYLNNLEKDSMYKRWRSNVNEILMPTFPGQLRYIRKNLFHAVYMVDPVSSCGLEVIDSIISLYENQLPIRFGVILYSKAFIKEMEITSGESAKNNHPEEDISTSIIRYFYYIDEQHGVQTAFKFLSNINNLRTDSGDGEDEALERHMVEKAFVETVMSKSKSLPQDELLKITKERTFEDEAHESSKFVFKMGLSQQGCIMLMNGLVYDANEEALVNAMNDELPRIQEQVYYGHTESHTDVLEKFFSESGISRYNPQIMTHTKEKPKFIALSESRSDKNFLANDISYLHSSETVDDMKPVTHLLVVDVTSKKGINLLRQGLHYLRDGSKIQ